MKKARYSFALLAAFALAACSAGAAYAGPSGIVQSLYSQPGGVSRTPTAKARDIIDAADYIAVPGASNAIDQAGVQKAINEAAARGGGRVRVRKPISNSWNLALLTVPASVLIDDERYSDAGHTAIHGTGDDVEFRIHGTSVTGGEGPSVVAVNNATSGDRTISFVSRYGTGAGTGVGMYMHFGVWDGSAWFPEYDMIASGADGFRSNVRVGYGTMQINAAYTGAYQYTQNKIFSVNKPAALGGGNLFEINTTAAKFTGEVQIDSANAPLRFYKAGALKWSLLSEFASAGQFSLYDHTASAAAVTFTSGAGVTFPGALAAGAATFSGNVVLVPGAASSPASNGQLTFALISNTALEIRVRGSDGVVRKAALALAP